MISHEAVQRAAELRARLKEDGATAGMSPREEALFLSAYENGYVIGALYERIIKSQNELLRSVFPEFPDRSFPEFPERSKP